jgi:acyl dehydratase
VSEALPQIDISALGRVVEGRPYRVTRAEIAAFADATNDRVPDCLAGRLAPPVYAINPVLTTMVAAKKLASAAFGFHGEHDFRLHAPILPEMEVVPQAKVIGIHQRSSGVTITVHVISRAAGTVLNEQYFVSFIPKAKIERSVGLTIPSAAAAPQGEPLFTVVSELTPDQTGRYAAASNDHDAYTTDLTVARSMGFPGLVVHGMLTVALSAGAVVQNACKGDPLRLSRLAVRLSRPLYLTLGERVVTRLWRRAEAAGDQPREQWSFDAQNRAGETILINGVAETAYE